MLDDILDYVENIRERPVWQPIPQEIRDRFRGELPARPRIWRRFTKNSSATFCPSPPETCIRDSWDGFTEPARP